MDSLLGIRQSAAMQHSRAAVLSEKLGLPLMPPTATPEGLFLDDSPQGLALVDGRAGAPGAVRVDFLNPRVLHRLRRVGIRSELLIRAVGIKKGRRPRLVDATAGLGGDALILAHAGCTVTLIERSPIVAALLADAICRSAATDPGNPAAALQLVEADATSWLAGLAEPARPDVVYLDPMYPDRGDAAAVRKEMQLLKQLLGSDEQSAPGLLQAALASARQRVVVKRPRKAPLIDSPNRPSHQISGRSTRFDVYVLHS